MFTGIVTDIGTVRDAREDGDLRLHIGTAFDLATVDLGASIACSGVCLTAIDIADGRFSADVMAESLRRSALGSLAVGDRVNVEIDVLARYLQRLEQSRR